MEHLFRKVNHHLSRLLTTLDYAYREQGINWSIQHYHSMFMRLLIPPEVSSYVHFSCPNEPFRDEAIRILESFKPPLNSKPILQYTGRPEMEAIKVLPHRVDFYQSDFYDNGINQLQDLTPDMENKLCQWIQSCTRDRNVLTKLDIINRASKMASQMNLRFQPNKEWYKVFMARNLPIKQLLRLSRSINRSQSREERKICKDRFYDYLANMEAQRGFKRKINIQETFENQDQSFEEKQIIQAVNRVNESETDKSVKKEQEKPIEIEKSVYKNEVVPQEKKIDIRAKYLADSYKVADNEQKQSWRMNQNLKNIDVLGYSSVFMKSKVFEERKQ